jgi:hypothetical protein
LKHNEGNVRVEKAGGREITNLEVQKKQSLIEEMLSD